MSTISIVDLQTMVMMIVGICLFFCFDDLDGLAFDYFIPEQFVFDIAGNIMGMCLKVFGKADKVWITLLLWTDDKCPEFCLDHLLLVHILCFQDKGGFLFLTKLSITIPLMMAFWSCMCPMMLGERVWPHLIKMSWGYLE